MALLTPDRYFSRITAIDIEADLLGRGYRAVLLDIDNTIRARDTGQVPRDVGLWLGRARTAGVDFCLVSNNWHSDVYQFAGELELPIVAKAMKPVPASFMVALRKLKAPRSEAVVVGDQLATDVLGAGGAGSAPYAAAAQCGAGHSGRPQAGAGRAYAPSRRRAGRLLRSSCRGFSLIVGIGVKGARL
ncbi:HAD hydrolase-like protein [uncultured Adlercreutzia sp.]|uniref:YqeG family HAD IIIA-type phosphatase n=1 Tax=uncultured Adlercreutzia sp. TaxID=875803 RepID=UPI0025A503D9|nr:HAD hydrolase-like protein [uncultured Adlercreutzia sp.]